MSLDEPCKYMASAIDVSAHGNIGAIGMGNTTTLSNNPAHALSGSIHSFRGEGISMGQ